MRAKQTRLGTSPVLTTGPCCGGGAQSLPGAGPWSLAWQGWAELAKQIFRFAGTHNWVMETSSLALELGLWEGRAVQRSGSQRIPPAWDGMTELGGS